MTVSYFLLYLKVAYYLSKEEMGFHKTLARYNFTPFFFKLPIRDIILDSIVLDISLSNPYINWFIILLSP